MGDNDNGYAEPAVYFTYQTEYRVCGIGIERACRLIAQKYLGVGSKRARYRYALLLTARELCGVRLCFVGQTDQLQQLGGSFFGFLLRYTRKLHREADVFQAILLHKQIEALKYHGYVPPCIPELCR